jgi:hypothetical protein
VTAKMSKEGSAESAPSSLAETVPTRTVWNRKSAKTENVIPAAQDTMMIRIGVKTAISRIKTIHTRR